MNTIFIGKSGLFKREKALAAAGEILSSKSLDVHPDFLMVEPENGKIPVSAVRVLADFIAFVTVEARKKVIIIDKCHLATVEFQQAILKLLEDSSNKAVFLLTTEEPLLDTIHSRCNTISVREWSYPGMISWIEAENLPVDPVALSLAEGRPGLYRDLLADREFLAVAHSLQDNLENAPEKAVLQLGALDEGYYDSGKREKELLLVGFMERFLSRHLADKMQLTVDQMLEAIDICCMERMNMRSRAYGKTENFRFYRRLHSILSTGCTLAG